MLGEKIKSNFDQANQLYDTAQESLFKPQEDIVPYMVCHNAHDAVQKYLISFLLKHDVQLAENTPVKTLIEQCRLIDTRFNDLHLDLLYKCADPDDVWMGVEDCDDVMALATKTKELISASHEQVA